MNKEKKIDRRSRMWKQNDLFEKHVLMNVLKKCIVTQALREVVDVCTENM